MNYRRPLLLAAALVLGGVAGAVTYQSPRVVEGQYITSYFLYVNPGGVSTNLTCGWHLECTAAGYNQPPFDQHGLDWGNIGGQEVYWRSWGGHSGFDWGGSLGSAQISIDPVSGCNRLLADVRDVFGGSRGRVKYTHTAMDLGFVLELGATSYSFPIGSVNGGLLFTQQQVGRTNAAATEAAACGYNPGTFGAHLHQLAFANGAPNPFAKRIAPGEGNGRYPEATLDHTLPTFSIPYFHVTGSDDYQNSTFWTLQPKRAA